MSHVDNWMLLLNLGEEKGLSDVNARLMQCDDRQQQFRLLDEGSWGGTKVPEVEVYGMAANHVFQGDVLQAIADAEWDDPKMSSVALSPQEGGWKFWSIAEIINTHNGER